MAYFKYSKENQEQQSFGGGEPFLKVDKNQIFAMDTTKSMDYTIRLLPPWSKEGLFAKPAKVHFRLGKDGRIHGICPNTVGQNLCPYCELLPELKGKLEFEVDYFAIKPSYRYYSNIIDMDNTKKGVQVWSYGPNNYFAIKKIQDKGDFGDLTDPENGHNLNINRKVQGKSIKDSLYPSPKPTLLDNPDWLDQLVDLDTILPDVNVELIQELFESHPFKVYEPHFKSKVSKVAKSKDEDNIPEFTSPKMEKETKPEVEKSATADEDMEAKIAKMRAKLQSRNAASEG